MHPSAHVLDEGPGCQVFADAGAIVVTGELDAFCAGRLGRALAGTPVSGQGLVLDLARLDFVDLAGCRVVAGWAGDLAARSVRLEITGASRLFRHMWALLGYATALPRVSFTDGRRGGRAPEARP